MSTKERKTSFRKWSISRKVSAPVLNSDFRHGKQCSADQSEPSVEEKKDALNENGMRKLSLHEKILANTLRRKKATSESSVEEKKDALNENGMRKLSLHEKILANTLRRKKATSMGQNTPSTKADNSTSKVKEEKTSHLKKKFSLPTANFLHVKNTPPNDEVRRLRPMSMEPIEDTTMHPLVNVDDTEFQNDITYWNIANMVDEHFEYIKSPLLQKGCNVIYGASMLLLLPEDCKVYDKHMFVRKRYKRRNAVHVYDNKGLCRLLTLYISLKNASDLLLV